MSNKVDSDNKRIAKNTIMLYIRMIIVLLVNLYVSRVVLQVLGVEDYGLFSLVGSVVAFLGFIKTSMAGATQRFLSYAQGEGNEEKLNCVFNSAFFVQIIIAVVVFVICETIGTFYINNYLNVDPSKLGDAHIVFQLSLTILLINIVTVPYTASIIANERLDIFALYSILEVVLKLGVAFLLPLFNENALIFYAALMLGICFIVQCLYWQFSYRHFKECKLRRNIDKKTIKEMLSYAGWNLFGTFSSVVVNQGVNMVLNFFFGLAVNAARGISFQVNGTMAQLYTNFQQALNPQIVKTYAAKDYSRFFFLITQGTRLAFFLLFVCALPIIFNMDCILKIWLGNVPEYTSLFCILVIINSLIGTMSQSLLRGALATGKIRKYQIIVSTITMMNLPLSIIALKIYPDPYLTTYIMIALSLVAFVTRLILLHQMTNLSIPYFFKSAIFPIIKTVVISTGLSIFLNILLPAANGFGIILLRLVVMFVICLSSVAVFGMKKQERQMVLNYVTKKVTRR